MPVTRQPYPTETRIRRVGPADERFACYEVRYRCPNGRWGLLFTASTEAEAREILDSQKGVRP